MIDTRPEIAVVGAGVVGLAAALALKRAKYRVALVGPHNRAPDQRTSALLAGSIDFLDDIGVWPQVAPAAAPLRTLRIVDATDRLIRAPEVVFESSEVGLETFGYNIANATLLAALDEAVVSRRIPRHDAIVDEALADKDSVRLDLSTNERIVARLAVAADGRKSTMREAAGIAVSEWRYDQAALVVNLRHSRPHQDTSTEFHTATGPFTLVPLPGDRSSLVWVGSTEQIAAHSQLTDAELAREIETRSASILGATEVDGKRQVFPLSGMNANAFAARRIALAGEAAHVFPPIGAQGLNLGYRDVGALAEILAGPLSDPGTDDLLARFDNARRSDVLSRTAAVDALNRTLLSDLVPVQGVRSLGLFLLDRIAPLRQAIMRRGLATQ